MTIFLQCFKVIFADSIEITITIQSYPISNAWLQG